MIYVNTNHNGFINGFNGSYRMEMDFSELDSFKYSLYCGLGKEFIDAYLSSEKNGRWGGDGFSKYDLAYDLLGIGIAYALDKLWKREMLYETKNTKIYFIPFRMDIYFN